MKRYSFFILLVTFGITHSAFSQKEVAVSDLDTSAHRLAKGEKESAFPGGPQAWRNFLVDNLKYPRSARKHNIQGTVVVQFIVNKDGSLSNIEIVSGPPELQAAALEVFKKSPRWIPARQEGKNVRSYKLQPIGFRL